MRVFLHHIHRRRRDGVCTILVALFFGGISGYSVFESPMPWFLVLGWAVFGLVPLAFVAYHYWPLSPQRLEKIYRGVRREHPHECPWCGYDISMSPGAKCSECGGGLESCIPPPHLSVQS
jgi:hypothetical protein